MTSPGPTKLRNESLECRFEHTAFAVANEGAAVLDVHPTIPEARMRELIFGHPSSTPEGLGPLPYLIDPPGSVFSPTCRFVRFRDETLRPKIAERPGDPYLPRFLQAVEVVLAWREALSLHERFWRPDPE
jgi:hypothetical protein